MCPALHNLTPVVVGKTIPLGRADQQLLPLALLRRLLQIYASDPAGPLDRQPGVPTRSAGSPTTATASGRRYDPCLAASPVPTIPYIPSGRDRAEPVGTPLLRIPLPPGVPSATTADLDALGAAAECQLGGVAARYSHDERAREQQAEPERHASIRYIVLGRPATLPGEYLSCFSSRQHPSFSDVQSVCRQRTAGH